MFKKIYRFVCLFQSVAIVKSLQIITYVEKSTSTQIAGKFAYDFVVENVLQLTSLNFFAFTRLICIHRASSSITSITVELRNKKLSSVCLCLHKA